MINKFYKFFIKMEIIIIKIQAIYRGFNVRKNNRLKKDYRLKIKQKNFKSS